MPNLTSTGQQYWSKDIFPIISSHACLTRLDLVAVLAQAWLDYVMIWTSFGFCGRFSSLFKVDLTHLHLLALWLGPMLVLLVFLVLQVSWLRLSPVFVCLFFVYDCPAASPTATETNRFHYLMLFSNGLSLPCKNQAGSFKTSIFMHKYKEPMVKVRLLELISKIVQNVFFFCHHGFEL